MYEGVHEDIVYSSRFDECSDLNMTYLGRTNMRRETKVRAEEKPQFQDKGIPWQNC